MQVQLYNMYDGLPLEIPKTSVTLLTASHSGEMRIPVVPSTFIPH